VLAVLVASACATQMEQPEGNAPVDDPTGGTGGDTAATAGMSMGGSLDQMGMGGSLPMGGVMNGGTGGAAMGGTAGKGAGGSAGKGAGGANTMGGKGGGAGMTAMGGSGGAGGSAGKGTGGVNTMGGKGGGAGMSAGGRGSGGVSMGGRAQGGMAGAAGGGAGTSGMMCVKWTAAPQSSGNIGNSAACFDVTGTVAGWQVSNLGMRTLTVNGKAAMPPTVPAADADGHRIFSFTAPPAGDDIGKNCSWSYW